MLNAAESTVVERRLCSAYLLLSWHVLLACTVNYCLLLLQRAFGLLEHCSSGKASIVSSSMQLLLLSSMCPE